MPQNKLNTIHQKLSTNHPQFIPGLSRIALTGKPASGKSMIINWLNKLGIETLKLDEITQQIYHDTNIQQEITKILNSDFNSVEDLKTVVRIALIHAPDKFNQIETIIHQEIYKYLDNLFKHQNKFIKNCIVIEIPLIIRSNWLNIFTHTIIVERQKGLRQIDLRKRGWSNSYIKHVEQRFLHEKYICKQAQHILYNNESKKDLWLQVKSLIQSY